MTIFGDLKEFPLIEVLGMLEQRVGVLRFTQLQHCKELDLHLDKGQLCGMRVDALRVKDSAEARSYLFELASTRQGAFIFNRRATEDLLKDYALSVRHALSGGAARAETEIQQYRAFLPDPATVFTVSQPTNARLEDDLHAFWLQAQFLLTRSSSAEGIAATMRLDLGWVQLALYKLRVAGFVRPVQRIREMQTPPPPTQAVPKPSLISKLLGALSFMRRAS